jgi:DnaJ-class molecular chaperone
LQVDRDYYAILNVPRNATPSQIRTAYRRIAMESHPDRAGDDPGASARFQVASEAYQVLSDPLKRYRYDRGFESIKSMHDLFARHVAGRRVLETLLPTAPAAPQKGIDLLRIVGVPTSLLRTGGSQTVLIVRQGVALPDEIFLEIPPNADKTPWCRLKGLGSPGKNGAEHGDLLIHLVPRKASSR